MKNVNYFKSDIVRLVKSYEIYVAILGVFVSMIFAIERAGFLDGSILGAYILTINMGGYMLVYVFGALGYATVFCEDFERQYIRYELIRGNLKKYILSKVIIVFFSSVAIIVLGTVLFIMFLGAQFPWIKEGITSLDGIKTGMYAGLISKKHYFLYCICASVQSGFLAGLLSVWSAFISLYVTNKVIVLTIPLLTVQLLNEYTGNNPLSIGMFNAYLKPFETEWQSLLFILSVTILFLIVFTNAIYRKIKKRL